MWIYYAIAFIVVGYILTLPVVKGAIGEWIVAKVIGKTEEGKQYLVNNVIFQDENGKSSQVDHIVINEGGIWAIETKNYSGRIYGEEHQLNWTQVLAYGKTKNKFYNPVKQNYTHICQLKKALGKEEDKEFPIHSVVVFVQDNIEYIKSEKVVSIFKLRKTIRAEQEKKLSPEEQKEYFERITEIKSGQITTREHVKNIREEQKKIEENICPRCGKELILKHGKYGDFMACPGYPTCRFTKKI